MLFFSILNFKLTLYAMLVLGIETSCDETGVALIEFPQRKILREELASQVEIHKKTKGVVPEVASRLHAETLPLLIERLKKQTKLTEIDLYAVANSPGLLGSLLVGVNFAKTLGFLLEKPLVEVNHLIAHFYSPLLTYPLQRLRFPALGLVVSGGHTLLILATAKNRFKIIGSTRDDAAGEAFDKIARLLDLGYPGGPAIEQEAQKIDKTPFRFTPPMLKSRDFDFSFSGLKTEVLRTVQKVKLKPEPKAALAKAAQEAIVTSLVEKTFLAVAKFKPQTFLLGGGVAANKTFRETLRDKLSQLLHPKQILFCERKYAGDNGSMVALAGYFLKAEKKPWYSVKALAQNTLL